GQDDYIKAAPYATAAYNIDSLDAGVADRYAVILMAQEDYAQARRILEFAVSMNQNDLNVRYHYAQALSKSGAVARAILELNVIVNSGIAFENVENARDLLTSLR
ncbi:MAG: tetratricopeptide repeat protein, partial [Kordiimonadaceae bacterium]|nr:tetratricopeptide repeat protein [Kordiimonadaceae bacterium]